MKMEEKRPVRILRIKQLMDRTGLSKSTIYNKQNKNSKYFDPTFPQRLLLGTAALGAVGWLEEEVDAWIEQCGKRR